MAMPSSEAGARARVPSAIRRLVVQHGGVADAWVHSSASQDGLTVRLLDDSGQVIAVVEGLATREVDESSLRRVVDVRDWMYEAGWEVKAAPPLEATPGTWLVLGDRGGAGAAFAAAVEARGGRAVIADAVAVSDPAAVEEVVRAAGAELQGVMYLSGITPPGAGGDETLAWTQQATVGLLHVAQAITRGPGVPPRLVVATQGSRRRRRR